jgi:hypothetical protein
MKIGYSLSRCVLDIVEGRVDPEDVSVLITGTHFDPTLDDQWNEIWYGYAYEQRGPWAGLRHREDEVLAVICQLWNDGKIHQPRKFGANPRSTAYHWREVVLVDEELDQNPAARTAWEQFKMIAGLSNLKVVK